MNADMRMAQVWSGHIKGKNQHISAQDSEQIHLIAKQIKEHCDWYTLRNSTAQWKNDPFKRVRAVNGDRR